MDWLRELDEYINPLKEQIKQTDGYFLETEDQKPHYLHGALTVKMYEEIQSLKIQIEQLKKQIK